MGSISFLEIFTENASGTSTFKPMRSSGICKSDHNVLTISSLVVKLSWSCSNEPNDGSWTQPRSAQIWRTCPRIT